MLSSYPKEKFELLLRYLRLFSVGSKVKSSTIFLSLKLTDSCYSSHAVYSQTSSDGLSQFRHDTLNLVLFVFEVISILE